MAVRVPRKTSDLTDGPSSVPSDGNVLAYDLATDRYQPQAFAEADKYYHHVQGVPATVWTIAHNFGRPPNVRLRKQDGTWAIADLLDLDNNTVQVTWAGATGGEAFLS